MKFESIEETKPIPGYDGAYAISACGRVISYKGKTPRILKQNISSAGYPAVSLSKSNRTRTTLVHRLVAESFVSGFVGGMEVNHIDGVKANNHKTNLEWVTRINNIRHARATGLIKKQTGRAARPVLGVRIATGEIKYYPSICSAGREGFWISAISNCVNGRSKTHLGHEWLDAGSDIARDIMAKLPKTEAA